VRQIYRLARDGNRIRDIAALIEADDPASWQAQNGCQLRPHLVPLTTTERAL
jgi:hypothetical protein